MHNKCGWTNKQTDAENLKQLRALLVNITKF